GELFRSQFYTVDVPVCRTVVAFYSRTILPVQKSITPPPADSRLFGRRSVFAMNSAATIPVLHATRKFYGGAIFAIKKPLAIPKDSTIGKDHCRTALTMSLS